MIVLCGHAALIKGKIHEAPVNNFLDDLIALDEDVLFVRNYMNGESASEFSLYRDGNIVSEGALKTSSLKSSIRYFQEIIHNFLFFYNKGELDAYIGVDPLNCFTGLLLRLFRRTKKVIFVTADYSKKRFDNPILNFFYHSLDRLCVSFSDEVWSVSQRIHHIREKMGLASKKNVYVPNVPSSTVSGFKNHYKNKYKIVTVGSLTENIDYLDFFRALKRPELIKYTLTVIGTGPREKELKEFVSDLELVDRVEFTGRLKLEEVFEILSKSGIGLALYNSKWGFNYYGDSMKCREYFSFGIPVITTDTHSTVEDIRKYNAGVVLSTTSPEKYARAVVKIEKNIDFFSANAIELHNDYEFARLDKLRELIK